jgi:hypothetical protein
MRHLLLVYNLGDETNGKLDYRRWLKEDGTSYTSGETWGWDGVATNSYNAPPSTDEGVVAVFDIDGINYSSSNVNTGTNRRSIKRGVGLVLSYRGMGDN